MKKRALFLDRDGVINKENNYVHKVEDFHFIDLEHSVLVGDKEIDIEAGLKAGVGCHYLVRTGREVDEENSKATKVFDNIKEVLVAMD